MRKTIKLAEIDLQGGTQPRAMIDMDTVHDYAQAYEAGAQMPPIVVFADGAQNWLADGFHRYHALLRLERQDVEAEVLIGTRRDAVLFSVGANAAHGLRRTNADKRKAVLTLLRDSEWCQWSDSQIAERCGVAHTTVGRIRAELGETLCNAQDAVRTVQRGGSTFTMDTTGIKESQRERKPKHITTSAAEHTSAISDPEKPLEPTAEEQVRFWSQACENLKVEIETMQQQVAARDREIVFLQRQLDAVGAAIGETNRAKIAARVKELIPAAEGIAS